ncbi:MAG: PaaX family transcriptional regulator C-terminal domain-containing protein [Antricoccus sp.]
MTTVELDSEARTRQPRALIVTTYGLYARAVDGWLSVASLVTLMAQLDVEDAAVRSAISRLKARGILTALRQNGVAGYSLTPKGRAILDAGDQRIFDRSRPLLEDGWLLAVYSVPESERHQRHQLRSRLAWLGFGTVAAGAWIAPRHLEAETRAVLQEHRLDSYVRLFPAQYRESDLPALVAQWWDLDSLAAMYEHFVAVHQPVARKWRRSSAPEPPSAYADYVATLTAWRQLPYHDPGIAPELLPRGWKGARAATLFDDIADSTAVAAHAFVGAVLRR